MGLYEFLTSIFGDTSRYEFLLIILGCSFSLIVADVVFSFILASILALFKH